MKNLALGWPFWAILSDAFTALTAILAKIGIENVNSDFATFIRTIVILVSAGLMLVITGNWQSSSSFSPGMWTFLMLSGSATGASWICYFRALKLGDAARWRRWTNSASCSWTFSRCCFSARSCRC